MKDDKRKYFEECLYQSSLYPSDFQRNYFHTMEVNWVHLMFCDERI